MCFLPPSYTRLLQKRPISDEWMSFRYAALRVSAQADKNAMCTKQVFRVLLRTVVRVSVFIQAGDDAGLFHCFSMLYQLLLREMK
jgi:hypothetical protein